MALVLIILIIAFVLAIPFIVCGMINEKTCRRYAGWNCPYQPRYDYYQEDYPRVPVSFIGAQGARLRGFLYPAYGKMENAPAGFGTAEEVSQRIRTSADGEQKKLLVFCHGIWSVPEEYMMLIAWFADHGYSVFTYCATGAGYSDGTSLKGLPNSPLDLHAALTYIEGDDRFACYDIFLAGHSWGGYAVGAVLNFSHPRVKAVCCLSGFNSVMEVTGDTLEANAGRFGKIFLPASWIIYHLLFGKKAGLSAAAGIKRSGIPAIVVHGENDAFIHLGVSSIAKHETQFAGGKNEVLLLTEKGRSEHGTYFVSREAAASYVELEKAFQPVREKYKGKPEKPAGPTDPDDMTINNAGIPAEELASFVAGIDGDLLAQPNAKLYEKIDRFFKKAAAYEQ